MVTVERALEIVLGAVRPLPVIGVPLLDSLGLVAALDVTAPADIPPFRNAAMDGFAVRHVDTSEASFSAAVTLRVVGQIAAGEASVHEVKPGDAVRIMTGAPMPEGADAVVRFEETDEAARPASERDAIGIFRPARALDNVRPAGEDIPRGAVAIPAGALLRPQEIGLLAALGIDAVPVHRRPQVAILSTGDEIADLREELRPGQIRNSNSYTLAAMVRQAGAEPLVAGVARDRVDDLRHKLDQCRPCDLIVTSGGVSLGDYDVVKDVLQSEGAIDVWQVRMKPGKPLAFGRIGDTPLLGLPGNPVAAAVSFEQFGKPAIRKMLGMRDVVSPTVKARLTERIDNRGRRRHYVRAVVDRDASGDLTVRASGDQGAGVLTSLTRANALLIVSEELDVAEPGMILPVQLLQ
jgi:molybdopterin molybdotransferase